MSEVKVTFGKVATSDPIASIKKGVELALMEAGLPGALSIDLSRLGMKTHGGSLITGTLNLKPTISKKDGRVMYNTTGEVMIGEVKIKPMGNWLLPKDQFSVDEETHEAYALAVADREAKKKAAQAGNTTAQRGTRTQAEIDAEDERGESVD